MKRRTLVVAASGLAAAGVAAILVAAFSANAADRSPESVPTGIQSTQNPRDVATYWTEERQRNATGR
jgi:ABC-type phosphate/phosphonate transport system substrate-binding protein